MQCRIFIAVTIYRYNTVRVLIYNHSPRIHTKCSYQIFKLLCTIYNLAFIQFICQVCKYFCRKFYTHTNVHTIRLGRNFQILAHTFHPFTSTSSCRNNTFITYIFGICSLHHITFSTLCHCLYRCHEMELDLIFQFIIKVLKNHVINVCSQVTYGCIQQMQIVL